MRSLYIMTNVYFIFTSNVEGHRVADSIAFNVVSQTGVDAGLLTSHILKYQALVANYDTGVHIVN